MQICVQATRDRTSVQQMHVSLRSALALRGKVFTLSFMQYMVSHTQCRSTGSNSTFRVEECCHSMPSKKT